MAEQINLPTGKLYLFAIGGTGARVLRSLLMLLASGVDINATQVVPVIFDLDRNNGNLKETEQLLTLYKQLQEKARPKEKVGGFFGTKVSLPDGVSSHLINLFETEDKEDDEERLKDFIAYETLITQNNYTRYLVDLLYGEKNLNDKLTEGFKGQPHIGSIIFYKVTKLKDFQTISAKLQKDDRIFFVSSTFGGTGASGFPTLLKILRKKEGLDNYAIRKNIKIGSLVVLPYYKLKKRTDKEEFIDSNQFMTKAKSALTYYDEYLEGYDAMYYISEPNMDRLYENNLGSNEQKNKAHFIEFIGALSIFHFMNLDKTLFKDNKQRYHEYADLVEADKSSLNFDDIEEGIDRFKFKLSQFAYLYKYFNATNKKQESVNYYEGYAWSKAFPKFFDNNKTFDQFMQYLKEYANWLEEMGTGDKNFSPFRLGVNDEDIGMLIRSAKMEKTSGNIFRKRYPIHFDYFNTTLNILHNDSKDTKNGATEHYFMQLIEEGSKKILSEQSIFEYASTQKLVSTQK